MKIVALACCPILLAIPLIASAQVPRSGAVKTYFCTLEPLAADKQFTDYWGDVFDSDAEVADINKAWSEHLVETYHVPRERTGGGCAETTAQFMQSWKAAARERWERATATLKKRQQDATSASPSPMSNRPIEQHTIIETGWKYTLGRVEHSATEMSADLRQLIDEEATNSAPQICKSGNLKDVYPSATGNVDCACFSQKLREYRLAEYGRVGEGMLVGVPGGGKILSPQYSQLLSPRGKPELDFKSCLPF